MSCASCARKKKGSPAAFFAEALGASGHPEHWGPVLWSILHILADRCGRSGSPALDLDEARGFEFIIGNLPLILPCEECSSHARIYIATNPLRCTDKKGVDLAACIQTWLLTFHNAVRLRKHQAIEINTLEELRAHYASDTIDETDMKVLTANVVFGVRTMLVKADNWKRWYIQFQRLRLLVGA